MRADCPEPGRLAAFATGNVPAEERAAIVAHLAECDLCAEIVADAAAWIDDEAAGDVDSEPAVSAVTMGHQSYGAVWRLAAGVAGAVLATAALLLVFRAEPAAGDLVAENSSALVAPILVAEMSPDSVEAYVASNWPPSTDRSTSGASTEGHRLRSFRHGQETLIETLKRSVEARATGVAAAPPASSNSANIRREYEAFGVWIEAIRLRCTGIQPVEDSKIADQAQGWIEVIGGDRLADPLKTFIEAIERGEPICGESGQLETLRQRIPAALQGPEV